MSFDQLGGDSPVASTRPFDDGFLGYDSSSNFADSPVFSSSNHNADTPSPPPPIYVSSATFPSDQTEFSSFSPEINGDLADGDFVPSDGPILPSLSEMQPEEGFALREWRSQNAIRLEEKETREKELLSQIIDEADEYKIDFYRRRMATSETNKTTNREKEKLFLESHEKFHTEADKDYWKTISELIPKEVPAIERRRGKKDQEKKPSVVMIQGPKPGKPTDLTRMRQLLVKLKHNTPLHLKPSPPAPELAKDTKTTAAAALPKAAAVPITMEAVAVA